MLRMLSPRSLFIGRHSILVIFSIRAHGAHALDALDFTFSGKSVYRVQVLDFLLLFCINECDSPDPL